MTMALDRAWNIVYRHGLFTWTLEKVQQTAIELSLV